MEKVEKKIDLNTLIEDFSFQLVLGKGQNELILSFRNVAKSVIDEIEFQAKGYDYFDEPIESNGKKTFTIILKHLDLSPGHEIKEYRIPVSKAIRKIDLKQNYVIYQDGTKEIYENSDYKIYYFDKFFQNSYKDKIIYETLKKQNKEACCYPKQNKDTWLCSCGYLNINTNEQCKYCRVDKVDTFLDCSQEAILHEIKEEEIKFYERMRKREVEREKRENKELFIFILKFFSVILFIVLFLFLLIHFIL